VDGKEGVTRVNSDAEDVIQGGQQDEYNENENSTIHTLNVTFVSNITNRKMKMSLMWEALRMSKDIFNPLFLTIILME